MNYAESISYLYSLGHETLAIKLGLETIRTLSAAFNHPHQTFPAVHIAGTNGKGSTAAMTAAVLRAAGYRTGLYTSPHLVELTERIQVNGIEITPDEFARRATEVRAASERLVLDGRLKAPPTFFEQVTMVAFLHFAAAGVDLAVLEVGLGGRLDATNLCVPVVTAITPLGLDHQKHLGDTLAAIAGEKAGIIKPGVPVVVAPQAGEAMSVISARASELSAPLIAVGDVDEAMAVGEGRYRLRHRTTQGLCDARLNLRGRHQVTNAMTVLSVVEQMAVRWPVPMIAVTSGLEKAQWPGRLEMIASSPRVLLDGAHNPAGATALREFFVEHFPQTPITLVFGAMADKAIDEMASLLFPLAQHVILTNLANARAAHPQTIAALRMRDVIGTSDVTEALAEAFRLTPPDGLICVCGSLYLVGEVKQKLGSIGQL